MRKRLLVCAALAGFGVAGSAQAANWPVAVGEQSRPPAGTVKGATLNEFLPGKLVINAGDSVTFTSASFHTVTYLGKAAPPALFLPDPAKGKYTGLQDAAGQDFYFDGLAKFVYNGLAFAPIPAKAIDGTRPVSSGVLVPGANGKPVSATFTFPKAGVYRLVCNIHAGMKVDVLVKAAGTPVPLTPSQVQAAILTQQTADFAKITKLAAATTPPPNTVYMGIGDSPTVLGYLPSKLTVKVGTTVTFTTKSASEIHNVAFGPKKWIQQFQKTTDLLPQGPTAPNQVGPAMVYGSDPPPALSYDGSNHGNGFLATMLNAGNPAIPLPRSSKVTFTKPGTYTYFCLIHGPDMSGTIVVTQ